MRTGLSRSVYILYIIIASEASSVTNCANFRFLVYIFIYCKTLNISVPLMLAKLAMRYHSLTFVDAKINVYRYACAVVCHVVSKAENVVLPVQLVAGKQLSLLLPSCDNPCSTSAGNRSIEQVRAKERRKRGKYNHHDAEVRAKIAKHACEYGNTCSHQ